jgi:glycogen operon protein
MLLAGDEFGRTQRGNNNAYSQDNEVSWVDWGLAGRNADLLRFARLLIAFRRTQPALRRARFDGEGTGITFHGVEQHRPDLSWASRSIALFYPAVGGEAGDHVYVIANAFWEPLAFELPRLAWRRVIDTSLASPDDIAPPGAAAPIDDYSTYAAGPRSVVVLTAPRPR